MLASIGFRIETSASASHAEVLIVFHLQLIDGELVREETFLKSRKQAKVNFHLTLHSDHFEILSVSPRCSIGRLIVRSPKHFQVAAKRSLSIFIK